MRASISTNANPITVAVIDQNNVVVDINPVHNVSLEVVPQPRVEARVDRGVAGPAGPVGPTGPQGTGINMKGTVPTVADLPATGNQVGDGWVVLADGYVYVWSA
jgi:hypothetical protein